MIIWAFRPSLLSAVFLAFNLNYHSENFPFQNQRVSTKRQGFEESEFPDVSPEIPDKF